MLRAVRLMVVAIGLLAMLGSRASAQPTTDSGDAEQAAALFRAGQVAYDRAQYDRAIGYFEQAYALVPRVELLYNIGRCHEQLGHLAEAIAAYTRYGLDVTSASERQQIRTHVAELDAALARQRANGEHAGSGTTAGAGTGAGADTGTGAGTSTGTTPRDTGHGSSAPVIPWIIGGAGVVFAVTGGVLFALGLSAKSAVEDAPARSAWADVADDRQRAAPLLNVGGILFAVGIAGIGVGVTLLVVDGSSSEQATTVSLTPTGVRIAGSF